MKKTVFCLAIIMALVFTGRQSAIAQISIIVDLGSGCGDTCTTQQVCGYVVEYELHEICSGHPIFICGASDTIVDCLPVPDFPFTCNYDCGDPHNDKPCYLFTATATKYCIGPPNGYLVKCSGSGYILKPCSDLDELIEIGINW